MDQDAGTVVEPAAALALPSYEQLFRQHFVPMVRLAALLGADDPDDIAQDAFVRLHRTRLRDPAAALPWLHRTVTNLSRSRLRHLRVVRRHAPGQYDPPAESAETQAALRAEHRAVLVALRALPVRQREVLVLRFWLDLSPTEVAATLTIAPGTVKSATSRGLAALAVALEEDP